MLSVRLILRKNATDIFFISVLLILCILFFYKMLSMPDFIFINGDYRYSITVESHIIYHFENLSSHAPKIFPLMILLFLYKIFGDILAQKLFTIFILLLGLLFVYFAHKHFIHRIWGMSERRLISISAFFGVLLFLFNPWTIDKILSHYWLFLALCSSYFLIAEIDKLPTYKNININNVILISVLFMITATMPQALFIYFGVMVIFFLPIIFLKNGYSFKSFLSIQKISLILTTLLLNSIWLIPSLINVLNGITAPSSYGIVEENFMTLSRRATFINIFQSASRWIWQGSGWLSTPHYDYFILGTNIWVFTSLLPIFISILALIFFDSIEHGRRRYFIFFSGLFLISVVLSSGSNIYLTRPLYSWFLLYNPIGWVIRDPYKNLGLMILSMSFLYSISFLFMRRWIISVGNHLYPLLIIAFIAVPISWGWPIITGDLNNYINYGMVKYPTDLSDTISRLNNQEDIARYNVLWYPPSSSDYYYKDVPEISYMGNYIKLNSPLEEYIHDLINKNSNETNSIFSKLGIKYIVLRHDLRPNSIMKKHHLIVEEFFKKNYNLISSTDYWDIYKTNSSTELISVSKCINNIPGVDFSKIFNIPCVSSEFISPDIDPMIISSNTLISSLNNSYVIKLKSLHHKPEIFWSIGSFNGGWLNSFTPYIDNEIKTHQYDFGKGLVFTWASTGLSSQTEKKIGNKIVSWNFSSQKEVNKWKKYIPSKQLSNGYDIIFDNKNEILKSELSSSTRGWKNINSPLIPIKYGGIYNISFSIKSTAGQGIHAKIIEYSSLKQIVGTMYMETIGNGDFDWKRINYFYRPKNKTTSFIQLQILHGHETKYPLPNKIWLDDLEVYDLTEYIEPVTLDLNINVENDGEYTLFLRYFKNNDGGAIDVLMDGESLGKITTIDQLNKFVWKKIGNFDLKKGKHKLTLINIDGFNAVNIFTLIPSNEYAKMEKNTEKLLKGKRLIYVFEAESDLYRENATVSNKYYRDASKGEVLEFNSFSKAWQNISIMRSDSYNIALKLNGDFKIKIDDKNYDVFSNTTNFTSLGPIELVRGDHTMEINLRSNRTKDPNLDVLWMYSIDKLNETIENVFNLKKATAVILDYKKSDPMQYTVKINATKPFLLSFAKAYDPQWYAEVVKKNGVSVNSEKVRPVPLDSIINGFWIKESGDIDLIIGYEPQNGFYIGAVLSLITLFLLVTYFIYDWRRKRKSNDTIEIDEY